MKGRFHVQINKSTYLPINQISITRCGNQSITKLFPEMNWQYPNTETFETNGLFKICSVLGRCSTKHVGAVFPQKTAFGAAKQDPSIPSVPKCVTTAHSDLAQHRLYMLQSDATCQNILVQRLQPLQRLSLGRSRAFYTGRDCLRCRQLV